MDALVTALDILATRRLQGLGTGAPVIEHGEQASDNLAVLGAWQIGTCG